MKLFEKITLYIDNTTNILVYMLIYFIIFQTRNLETIIHLSLSMLLPLCSLKSFFLQGTLLLLFELFLWQAS